MANKTTHTGYSVRDNQDADRRGGFFMVKNRRSIPHKDGKGLDVVLDALPVSGRVGLRISQPKPAKETT